VTVSKDNPPVPLDANQKKLLSEMMQMAVDIYNMHGGHGQPKTLMPLTPVAAAQTVNDIFQYLLEHCFNKAVVDRPDNAPESTV
jgi:hypothetical protein